REALLREHGRIELLGFEQQCRIRRQVNLALNTRILQQTQRVSVADREQRNGSQVFLDELARAPLIERSRADCVDRNGHARFVCERNFPQIHRDVEVVEKTASTEDEQVELLDLRSRLLARHLAHGHCTIYSVSSERVFGIARENGDRTDARNAAQLWKDAMEDRLVAEIEASV